MKCEPKTGKNGKSGKFWNILAIKARIGIDTSHLLLFAHSFLGCDTTSKPYKVCKGSGLQLVREKENFRMAANYFYIPRSTYQ